MQLTVGQDRLILPVRGFPSVQLAQRNAAATVGAVANRAYGGSFPSLQM